MNTSKRCIALSLALCVAAVAILSGVFIAAHIGHTHDTRGIGGTCATCAFVVAAENILRHLSLALAVITLLASLTLTLAACVNFRTYKTIQTPVALKVRLNN